VYAYVAARLGAGSEAEDVTSEVFLHAVRGSSTYDPAKGPPIAWLLGIARRAVSDTVARRLDTVADLPDAPDEQNLEERAVARLSLAAAVAALDEDEQDLLALRFGADLTARRIGEVLGLQTNTVEVKLHRTLARLRGLLEQGEPPASAPIHAEAHTREP